MKIIIICKGFKKSNLNKLPWKYIFELTKYLNSSNEVVVLTDAPELDVDEIDILYLKKLFIPLKGESEELIDLLNKEKPDKCIMLMGMTSFLRIDFRIEQPVIGVFTSPIYSYKELIKNIGLIDLVKYRKYTTIHILNSLIPSFFVKKFADRFENMVFLSKYTCQKLNDKGFPKEKSIIIPLGIDEHFFSPVNSNEVKKIRKRINPDNIPLIIYFTSPLTLRGTDILVKAFAHIRKEKKCKLIFLSRIDYSELKNEEEIIKKIASKLDVLDFMEIISDYLSTEKLKLYLSTADLICIPFKLVISDVPISILEAMALGKPVISTNISSIPELLPKGITVNSNDSVSLAKTILTLISDENMLLEIGKNNKIYMENYPKWDETLLKFNYIVWEY